MKTYRFIVVIEAETQAQAQQVLWERIGHDEDYGFDYTIDCADESAKESK